jgi:hypothetical protein
MIRSAFRLAMQHPSLTITGLWLVFGGVGRFGLNPFAARVVIVLAVACLSGLSVVARRLWTLHKAGRVVGPIQFAAMLVREVSNRLVYRQQFRRACLSEKDLRAKDEGRPGYRTPHLYRLTWQADESFTAVVYPGRMGVPKGGRGFVDRQESIRRTLGVADFQVRERPKHPGVFNLLLSNADWLDKQFPLAELPWGPKGTLEYGMRSDGSAAWLYAHQSVMISGLTRRGKSVTVRVLLAALQRKGIPTDLYIADPKGGVQMVEWSQRLNKQTGCIRVKAYEIEVGDVKARSGGVAGMLADVEAEMDRRYVSMRLRGMTQHVPTVEEPLLLVVFDESIPLYPILLEGHKGPAGKIAYSGAGAACALWLLTQAADKAVMGVIRDLVPQRLSLATKTWTQTEMALGEGAHMAGALCHQLGERVGVGYSGGEADHRYTVFRTPMVSDAESREIAKGKLPDGFCDPPSDKASRPCYVYHAEGVRRFPDGTVGPILLYVGKAWEPNARLKEHRREPDPAGEEWRTLVWRYRTVSQHATEKAALAAERDDIERLGPYWNVVHNDGNELFESGEPMVLVPAPTRKSRRQDRRRPVAAIDAAPELVDDGTVLEPTGDYYGSE